MTRRHRPPTVAMGESGPCRGPGARHRVRASWRAAGRLHHRHDHRHDRGHHGLPGRLRLPRRRLDDGRERWITARAPQPGSASVIVLIGFIIALLYFPFFWARGGQTPGMRPFGLRVVRGRDGSSIGWGTALLRLVGLWVAAAVFYIGYIWIFIDKRRRGWQDLIAGTVVIKQP